MMKRTLTLLMAVILLTLAASPALAAPKGRVDLKTKRTAAVLEGSNSWVTLSWAAKNMEASDFRVEATTSTRGVTVSYPDNTGSYTSLMVDDTLSSSEIDFTALKLSVPYGTKSFKLTVTATWTANGDEQSKKHTVKVPVAKFKGDEDVVQSSDDAGTVSLSDGFAWLSVEWTGVAPSVQDVRMTVTNADGATVAYPDAKDGSAGTYTSLVYDDVLTAGESDDANVRVDASGMEPGTYTLQLKLSYTKAGSSETVEGKASFTVKE